MNNEKRKQLINEINHYIDDDCVRIEQVFDFDDEIKIAVEEYKTEFNDGYCITLQTIRVADYFINCHHDDGEKLVIKAETLRASINAIGIKETIEKYTKSDGISEKIREWKDR